MGTPGNNSKEIVTLWLSSGSPDGAELMDMTGFSKYFRDGENDHLKTNAVKEKQPIWCRISAPMTLLTLFQNLLLCGCNAKEISPGERYCL